MVTKEIPPEGFIDTHHEHENIQFGMIVKVRIVGLRIKNESENTRRGLATMLAFCHLADTIRKNGIDPHKLVDKPPHDYSDNNEG